MKKILFIFVIFIFSGMHSAFSQNVYSGMNVFNNNDTLLCYIDRVKLQIYRDILYIENRKEFNPYTLSFFWKKPLYTSKVQNLDVFYKKPEYEPIKYHPVNLQTQKPKEYQAFMNSNINSKKLAEMFNMQFPLDQTLRNIVFSQANVVKYDWDEIPEPSKFFDRGYLATKKSEQYINELLRSKNDYDTKRKIEKLQKIKTPWMYEGTENIMLSQVHFTNWVKGGESSVSLASDLRLKAIYKKDKYTWENYAIDKLGYVGQAENKGRINNDMIELNSKIGLNASERWYYSAFTDFKTQFFNGYESRDKDKVNPISGFMSPAYWTFAVGMDYKIPKSKFTLMISPLTSNLTMILDTSKVDPTRYGVDNGKKVKFLNGGSLTNNFSWDINEDFNLKSMLSAFYEYFAKSGKQKQVQFDWELILDMKINVWLSARVLTHFRYFTNESEYMQFQENLSLSFRYIVRYKK